MEDLSLLWKLQPFFQNTINGLEPSPYTEDETKKETTKALTAFKKTIKPHV